MMFMISNVMLDSSILVEYSKNSKTKLLVELISDIDTECFINETVISEYLYYFLGFNGGRSPRATQSAGEIHTIFETSFDYSFIKRFSFLPNNDTLFLLVPGLMKQYNLLANDAIMLATCKIHSITHLASHDSDFKDACKGEAVILLTE